MKKMVALAAFAAVAATASFTYAGMQARTGVNFSLHDMNYYGGFDGLDGLTQGQHVGNGVIKADVYNRVCVFCHTPHNATVDEPGSMGMNKLPLWGNFLTNKIATPYQWATPENVQLGGDPLIGPSRLCMTCHDGTLAVDAHISNGGTTDPDGPGFRLSGSRAIGSAQSELNLTHPIGFDYIAAKRARNITNQEEIVDESKPFATAVVPNGDQYNNVTRGGTRLIRTVLYNYNAGDATTPASGIMTCASCHEVHNKENVVNDVASDGSGKRPNYFLYAKEQESLICLSCHIK